MSETAIIKLKPFQVTSRDCQPWRRVCIIDKPKYVFLNQEQLTQKVFALQSYNWKKSLEFVVVMLYDHFQIRIYESESVAPYISNRGPF